MLRVHGVPSWLKVATGLVATAAAIVGWSLVTLQGSWLDDLEAKLAEARQVQATARQGRPQAEANATVGAQLQALERRREAIADRVETLESELQDKTIELATVGAKVEASDR